MVLALEALFKLCPQVYIDSMGYSFSYPIFRFLAGCEVAAYVHYPTISTDMVHKVEKGKTDFNNDSNISKSKIRTYLKLIYYYLYSLLYKMMGKIPSVIMVNPTWTYNHIKNLWNPKDLVILYPPVDCNKYSKIKLGNRMRKVISIGQFRPEKNHLLQIEAFEEFLKRDKKIF